MKRKKVICLVLVLAPWRGARQGMSSFETELQSRGIIQRLLRNLLVPCALSATWDKMMGLFWGKKQQQLGKCFTTEDTNTNVQLFYAISSCVCSDFYRLVFLLCD